MRPEAQTPELKTTCRFSLLAPLPPAVHRMSLFYVMKLFDLEYFLCCSPQLPEQRQILF